jgi:hypothetical protein
MDRRCLIGALVLASSTTACNDLTVSNVPDLPPEVVIIQPLDDAVVLADAPITFRATVYDFGTPPERLQLAWGSSLDGEMRGGIITDEGEVTLELPSGLSAGEHRIELTAVDPDGQAGSDTVGITAEPNTAPSVTFVYPTDGASVGAESPLTLVANIVDEHTPTPDLVLIWESDLDGQLPGEATIAGTAATLDLPGGLSGGSHSVTVRAIDPGGAQGADTVSLEAGADNQPPTVEIVLPILDDAHAQNTTLVIEALFTDDNDSAEQISLVWGGLMVDWAWAEEEGPEHPTSDGRASFTVLLDCTYYDPIDMGTPYQYQVSVIATDTGGLSAQDWVTFWSNCNLLD